MTTAPGERLPYLLRALKAPRILDRLQATAERARAEGWPYEQFLEALGDAEVFAREASGARQRIRAAGFPAPKTLEDFDFAANPGAERPLITHLAQLAWIEEAATVCLIGPPRHRQTHVATAFGDQGLSGRHRTLFATAQQRVDRLEGAQHRNSLDDELRRLDRYRLQARSGGGSGGVRKGVFRGVVRWRMARRVARAGSGHRFVVEAATGVAGG